MINKFKIDITNSSLELSNDQKNMIKDTWNKLLEEARSNNQELWDENSYRLENYSIENNTVNLKLSLIPYSVRYSLRTNENLKKELEKIKTNALVVQALILTTDNKLVVGIKSGKYLTHLNYTLIGGSYGPVNGKDIDPIDSINSEVEEEIFINKEMYENFKYLGMYKNDYTNFVLVFKISVKLSSKELDNKFKLKNEIDELSELKFIEPSEFKEFVYNNIPSCKNIFDLDIDE